jgi:hypothetical protein
MQPPFWNRYRLLTLSLVLVFLVAFELCMLIAPPGQRDAYPWLLVPAVVALVCFGLSVASRTSTAGRLRAFLGTPRQYKVFDEAYPTYRYVDLCRALEHLAAASARAQALEHTCPRLNLQGILRDLNISFPTPAPQTRLCVGYEQHTFVPGEIFWCLEGPPGLDPADRVVVRLSSTVSGAAHVARLEVAARAAAPAAVLLKWLADDALAHSIFRGQFLEVRYFTYAPYGEYDSYHVTNEITVVFKPKPAVGPGDIILDEHIARLLRRNVFDVFAQRECLGALGLPRKRALLFYGPPGTGKTHTCRHIHTLLGGVTSILVTGQSLVRLQEIGKFARQMHPALVVIEDVDLVFTARDANPYGTALGDLMDQLDGFSPDEDVLFLLTTNAIERVEQAIRDRPGRINQCVYFGLPGPELRRRYLAQYLRPYDTSAVDLDHLVRQTEQTSQAFLKEYVLRAVQIAAEAADFRPPTPLPLTTEYFDVAFEELTGHGDPHGHSIMGFRLRPRTG